MKKFLKRLIIGISAVAIVLTPTRVTHADDTIPRIISADVQIAPETEVIVAQTVDNELATLKAREQDPETGIITKFFLRFRINQLKNQLAIKKALN
jgi:hypothetical protein